MRLLVGDAQLEGSHRRADLDFAMPSLMRIGAAALLALAVFAGSFAVGRADDDSSGARVGTAATRLPAELPRSPVKPLGSAAPLPRLAAPTGSGPPAAVAPQEPQGSPPPEAFEAP
jgi:hypothetical protein